MQGTLTWFSHSWKRSHPVFPLFPVWKDNFERHISRKRTKCAHIIGWFMNISGGPPLCYTCLYIIFQLKGYTNQCNQKFDSITWKWCICVLFSHASIYQDLIVSGVFGIDALFAVSGKIHQFIKKSWDWQGLNHLHTTACGSPKSW